jgi:cation:H+ antiporter
VWIWPAFIGCSALVVYSGSRLSRWGEVIADKTGWGGSWVGVALLASVTSLPELVSGVSAVTYVDNVDLAIGGSIGSCAFNLFLLAVLDAFHRIEPISSRATQGNVLTAAFGVLMLAGAAVAILLGPRIPAIGWIGPYSLFFVGVYLIAMRLIFRYQRREVAQLLVVSEPPREAGLGKAAVYFGLHSMVVVAAALFLPKLAAHIAQQTGLGSMFVGSLFVAMATSLPEFVVSYAAIRLGSVDLAVGNLLGSNLFNVAILAVEDACCVRGPLLSRVDSGHLLTALSAMAMTSVFVVGLTYRSSKRPLFLAWDSLIMAGIFIANTLLLYATRGR